MNIALEFQKWWEQTFTIFCITNIWDLKLICIDSKLYLNKTAIDLIHSNFVKFFQARPMPLIQK